MTWRLQPIDSLVNGLKALPHFELETIDTKAEPIFHSHHALAKAIFHRIDPNFHRIDPSPKAILHSAHRVSKIEQGFEYLARRWLLVHGAIVGYADDRAVSWS